MTGRASRSYGLGHRHHGLQGRWQGQGQGRCGGEVPYPALSPSPMVYYVCVCVRVCFLQSILHTSLQLLCERVVLLAPWAVPVAYALVVGPEHFILRLGSMSSSAYRTQQVLMVF